VNLAEAEGQKYRAVWGNDRYRDIAPGMRYLDSALEWLKPTPGASFTDWGCGTGRAGEALADKGFAVRLVDIAPNAYRGTLPFTTACLWQLDGAAVPATDYGYCTDVMEHIPTEYVDDVLAGIAARTVAACYFQIALFEDHHYTQHGQLHLTVKPGEWWQEHLSRHFKAVEVRKIKLKHLLAVASCN
jgi:hypothetical protein